MPHVPNLDYLPLAGVTESLISSKKVRNNLLAKCVHFCILNVMTCSIIKYESSVIFKLKNV